MSVLPNSDKIRTLCEQSWEDDIIPTLKKFIAIPNKSPAFDANWQKNGHIDAAVKLVADWVKKQAIPGLELRVLQLPKRTPVIFIEIPGTLDKTILMYGHIDKQPEMHGWMEGLSPWEAVLKGDKLYGRGGADDGYAIFASILAIKALKAQNSAHSRIVILIENSEESGSIDLPYYIDELEQDIGTPELIICLDSGCGNYEQLWHTTSLRGIVAGTLRVEVLTEGVHSGYGTGIMPSSFRIIRQLLSRVENKNTGEILLSAFHVNIPEQRIKETRLAASVLGDEVYKAFPRTGAAMPVNDNMSELLLNRTWRPALEIIACEGIPSLENASNVLRPYTTLTLSIRTPHTCDVEKAAVQLKQILEADPPYKAKVTFDLQKTSSGWHSPLLDSWLKNAMDEASDAYFGKEALAIAEGGSIPFMAMLGKKFPKAQFLITGILGPHSNAHGPNEFLHIPAVKRLTCCISHVIAAEAAHE